MSRGFDLLEAIVQRLRRSGGKTNALHSQGPRNQFRRRLLCEPLEERRLLSLTVESLTPTTSGFVAHFSDAIETSNLNLYDAQNAALGQADVVLQGNTVGNVSGSLLVKGNELTFIKTGGPLVADTYTVTLRSAADAIKAQATAELLDGNADGQEGGNYVSTFTAAAPQTLVVGLPDFASGPGQALSGPAQGSGVALSTGLPIQLSNAAGVTSLQMTLTYDPSVLTISSVGLGADAPEGSQVQANLDTAGQVTIAFFSLAPLGSGKANIISLVGSVAQNAIYGAAQVLRVSQLSVNAGGMQATADDALQVVAFPGDATASGNYDTEDARLIARVGVELDSGFAVAQPTAAATAPVRRTYPTIDPMIIGDVTGDGTLGALDASDMLRRVVGLTTPNIPVLPSATSSSTVTTVLAVGNSFTYGQSLTLTATVVATTAGASNPTGVVTFKEGASTLGTGTLVNGVATFTTSTLAAGLHSITAYYGSDTGFYASVSNATGVSVAKAALTVSGITANNKVYDGTTIASLSLGSVTLVGLVAGEDVSLVTTSATGAFADANVGTAKSVIVSGLSLSGTDSSNYTLTQPSVTADITPATLTVSGLAANDKVYDGATNAVLDLAGASLQGLVVGDSVTLTGGTATFADKNVGADKAVTVTGLGLSGTSANNYVLASNTASLTADITAKALTITGVTANSKVYDGTTAVTLDIDNADLVGVVDGDSVSVTSGTAAFTDKNVGVAKAVNISGVSLTGADAGNYTLTPTSVTADITAKALTVTGVTAESKLYDGTTNAAISLDGALLVGVLDGESISLVTTSATGAFADANVGTAKSVIVSGLSLSGTDSSNYTLTQPSVTADITPATLTVSGLAANDKVYDGATNAVLDLAGASLQGLVVGDSVTLTGGTATFTDKNVGADKAVTVTGLGLSGTSANNYVLASNTASLTADITAKALTVTGITAQSKVYDGTTSATLNLSGATLAGLVTGDSVNVTGGTAAFADKNVGTAKPVNVSGLSLSGTDSGNYTLTQPSLTADITAKALTVTGITAENKVYDGTTNATLHLDVATLVGVMDSEDVLLVTAGATGAFEDANVGAAKLVVISGLSLSGAAVGNYTLTQPTTTADITAAVATGMIVHVSNATVTEGQLGSIEVYFTNPTTLDHIAAYNVALDLLDADGDAQSLVQFTSYSYTTEHTPIFGTQTPQWTAISVLPSALASAQDTLASTGDVAVTEDMGLVKLNFTALAGSAGTYQVKFRTNLLYTNFANGESLLLGENWGGDVSAYTFADGTITVTAAM